MYLLDFGDSWVAYSLLFIIPIGGIFVFFQGIEKKSAKYSGTSGLFLALVKFLSKKKIRKLKEECEKSRALIDEDIQEKPKQLTSEKHTDRQILYAMDQKGNSLYITLAFHHSDTVEVSLFLRLGNGTTYLLPNEPKVLFCNAKKGKWKAEGLSLFVLEPYRKIRIVYNGLLKKLGPFETKEENVEHIKLNFIWNACDRPLFYPENASMSFLLDALTEDSWKNDKWLNILNSEQGYEQYGALQGLLTGEAFTEAVVLQLPCFRQRYWGISHGHLLQRNISVVVVGEDGTLFSAGAKSFQNENIQLKYGSLLDSIGDIWEVTNHDIQLDHFSDHCIPSVMTVHLVAKRKMFKCVLHLDHKQIITTYSDLKEGWEAKVIGAKCMLGDQLGVGFVTFWTHRHGTGTAVMGSLLHEPTVDTNYDFIAPFFSKYCCNTNLAGGKGSSLGLLHSLTSQNFYVPDGFVILAPTFNYHVKQNLKIQKGIADVVDICRGHLEKDLAVACKRLVDLFASTPVDAKVTQSILNLLNTLRQNGENNRWAARSSGITEDSEDLSAAGQNATVLGCTSESDVLKAVGVCWGSLFTFQSVEYRRQHGLEINTSMGVVIQRMVPSDKAGVLFTCHPATGDPSQMVITSNFGIGESVVSGEVDPDTITLSCTWDGNLSIHSQHIGLKKHIINMSPEGVESLETDSGKSANISLTNEEAIRLGRVGLELEKMYGSPRDIEWAFFEDKLYLLQSRPITTLNTWTDFELLHEFDSPVVTDQELYTTANTGEVFPGATSSLTYSIICTYISNYTYKYIMETDKDPFVQKFTGSFNHHVTLNVTNCFLSKPADKIDKSIKVLDIAIFGHLVIDEKLHAVGKSRVGVCSKLGQIKQILDGACEAFKTDKYVKDAIKIARDFRLPNLEDKSACEMLNIIANNLDGKSSVFENHSKVTRVSVFYQFIAINVLAEGTDDLTTEHYHDIGILLSSCSDVVSAEVPKTLERIAMILKQNGLSDSFIAVKPREGVEWLHINCPDASSELCIFLEKHGHRGFRELDIMSKSWGEDPSAIIEMLQVNCKSKKPIKPTISLSPEDTVASLITPKNNTVRKILKFLVKRCRKSVSQRETTKSELVRVVNESRIAIRKLGKRMVQEGIIPDERLVYHLTVHELKQVVRRQDPNLIHKAMRRQRLYPKWDKMKIPELLYGYVQIDEDDGFTLNEGEGNLRVVGTPVCPGNVTARACVITSLDDIHQLQTGDVLITCSTDVGWSPYFPLLSGVVTELGGIISHGAVVAREYGLPCVVGVVNATRMFKTGDKVLLSAKLGVLELVTSDEEQN